MARKGNFSKSVIQELRKRAGEKCSNPLCRANTAYANPANPYKGVTSGDAAHIHAAAPGGRRHDAAMTKEEINAISNAIWLCKRCAWVVDRDEEYHTAEMLRSWKEEAERRSFAEKDSHAITQEMVQNTILDALAPFGRKSLPNAIENIISAEEKLLNRIDPAFGVKVTGATSSSVEYVIYPKMMQSAKIIVHQDKALEFFNKYRRLIEHGEKLDFDLTYIYISGSPLLDFISSRARLGQFSMIPGTGRPAILKISLKGKDEAQEFFLDDIHGEIVGGTKSVTFSAESMNGLISYELIRIFGNADELKFGFRINFDIWNGVGVMNLQFFKKFKRLFDLIKDGWAMSVVLEIDGEEAISGADISKIDDQYLDEICFRIAFIDYARTLSRFLNKNPIFSSTFEFSNELFSQVEAAARAISGEYVSRREIGESIFSANLEVENEEAIHALNSLIDGESWDITIRFRQSNSPCVAIFGDDFILPPLDIDIAGVCPNERLAPGATDFRQSVPVKFIAKRDCVCTYRLAVSEEKIRAPK